MFLAFVELAGVAAPARDLLRPAARQTAAAPSRVVQLQFPQFETAKIWAREESSRHREATGNAVVFQTAGPFLSVVWEREGGTTVSESQVPEFVADQMLRRV